MNLSTDHSFLCRSLNASTYSSSNLQKAVSQLWVWQWGTAHHVTVKQPILSPPLLDLIGPSS